MCRGQVLRRAYRLAPVLHRSHGALDASRRRRRGLSVGGLSRAAIKRVWTFSSRRKNRRSASTAPASRHAASSMKSDRFFPSASAARSIRARCLRFARRLIVTSRPCRSCLSVLAMGFSSCFCNQLQSCPHIVNTRSSGRRHLVAPGIGWQNPDRMSSGGEQLPDWERLLAAERHLQKLVPGSVLVGGTAAAIYARHRVSLDGDHVLEDLRSRFDDVLAGLEAAAGWRTERVQRPVLILGELDGVLTGIRQLRRTRPLETEEVAGLRVPTLAEMARIQVWLLATRHTVRDYLDTVVLLERLGEEGLVPAMRPFDENYRQHTGASPLAEVDERLESAGTADLAEIDPRHYRALQPPWNEWAHVAARGRHWAQVLARVVLEGGTDD